MKTITKAPILFRGGDYNPDQWLDRPDILEKDVELMKKAGMNHLDGVQAVAYGRLRLMDTDYERTARQRKVISLAFEKAKKLDLDQLNKIANEVLPSIKTNITTNQMMEILLALNSYKITDSVSWPYDWTDWTYNGIWYGPPVTLKSNVTQLHEEFFNQKNYEPTDTVKEISDRISSLTGRW